jgi:hypothetical protein
MKHLSKLLLLSLTLTSPLLAPLSGQDKKPNLPPELTSSELHTVERFSDLYQELLAQAAEAQTRAKVIQEMQQKLMADFNAFQAATVAARGFKAGEASVDLQQRKVTPIPPPTAAATPAVALPSK